MKRPLPMSRAQRDLHVAKGHVNYYPGCEFRVRTRGRPDPHRRSDLGDEMLGDGDEEEPDSNVPKDMPTVSFDFCFLS